MAKYYNQISARSLTTTLSNLLRRTHAKTLLFCVLAFCFYTTRAQIAPISPPAGKFAIDGGLQANTPTSPSPFAANQGDWVSGPGGTGGFVLSNAGVPVDAAASALKTDPYNSGSDNIFTTGSKFNDYISALQWTSSTAPNKNDINNAMYHVSKDPSTNNQWAIIAGDRLSTSGTSYIDFEFLQNTLTRNANGTFTGAGPAGGRTVGDLVASMEYTNGGAVANVLFYKWQLVGSTYQYVQFTPAAADAFAMTNAANEPVPFGAFGGTTYQPFAFVEAAINITKVIIAASGGDPCAGLSIKTLWIKTKASSSGTAALKDFVDPIPVSFTFGSATIAYNGPYCATGTASVTQTGFTGGTYSASPTGLSINPSTGEINLGASTPGTYTVTYSFVTNGCTKTTTAPVKINPLPTATIGGTIAVCKGATAPNVTFTGAGGTAPYTFTYNINGGSNLTVTTSSGNSVTVPQATSATGTFVYTLVSVQDANCSQAQTGSATITVNPLPTATIGGTIAVCKGATAPNVTFTGAGGTAPYTFTYNINGGSNLTVTTSSGNSVTVAAPTGTTGTFVYNLVSVKDASTTQCTQNQTGSATITVNPLPTATIGGTIAVCKDASQPNVTFTGANGTAPYTFTYTLNGGSNQTISTTGSNSSVTLAVPTGTSGTYTYALVSVQDANCSQAQTGSATITVKTVPTAPSASVVLPSCTDATMTLKINSPQSGVKYIVTQPGSSYNQNQTYSGSGDLLFTGLTFGAGYSVVAEIDGCLSASDDCGTPVTIRKDPVTSTLDKMITVQSKIESATKVLAAPNPYSDKIRFMLRSGVSGQGSLELYNMLGQKVKTVFRGYVQKDQLQTIEYNVPGAQRSNLIYVFRVGEEQVSGKLIGLK